MMPIKTDAIARLARMKSKRIQKTPKGLEIPVPKRREFFDAVEKVSGGRSGRKRPAEKDQPRERSD
jgi:hypothetical protein